MASPSAAPTLLYRSTRLLRTAFQQLHQQQQRADDFCDVVLQAEGEAVVAHCCILSVCSPFLMEQLGQELPARGSRMVLELGGLKIEALRKLVRFLYTAELEATPEEVQEVLAAARRLRITALESLQLHGGHLVRLGPQHQLNHSCLPLVPHGSPGSEVPPGATKFPPSSTEDAPGSAAPGPVGRLKLRKSESGGCWEVVQEQQPPTDGGVGRRSPLWQPIREGSRKLGQESWQHGGLEDPEDEEVDVGTEELCLPPGTICVWPCPSSEEEEVDILE
ncbi:BTB/POZ domain-containing protein 18 [Phaenicophaeus curvirostris]|uniref:BTB/POZ domain-containing protein 18 n=1 Tax=Phaenicophaeus curvirostris TaxID=33595 RepID=UPI0037F0C23A